MVEWITAFSEIEAAHFAFHATGITLAATGDGAPGSNFPEHAIHPGLALLGGDSSRRGKASLEHARRMDERQVFGRLSGCCSGLGLQAPNGGVRKKQRVEFLFDEFRPLAAQNHVAAGQTSW